MGNDIYCVITFESVGEAMMFEKRMKSSNIPLKLIPAPREVSASCGIAAEVDCHLKEEILSLCDKLKLEFENFHELQRK